MLHKFKIDTKFFEDKYFFDDIIFNFETKGTAYGNQDRNTLRLFNFNGDVINVKSFRVPNLVNQIVYRFFRKSKAQRSYEYAKKLIQLGIGTPEPIAYYEFKSLFLFKKSYYISKQQNYDLTYRELTTDFNYPNYKEILRAFTCFTYKLHEKEIQFLDHSPGNTLIDLSEGEFKFYLVDLNRMKFGKMNFIERMKNFAKLTIHKPMVEVMSNEYAKISGYKEEEVFSRMWEATQKFQERFHRKRRLKKRLKFWKNYEN